MNEDTKLSDLTVAEFRKLMQDALIEEKIDTSLHLAAEIAAGVMKLDKEVESIPQPPILHPNEIASVYKWHTDRGIYYMPSFSGPCHIDDWRDYELRRYHLQPATIASNSPI
jgi:hypothetical protein